MSPHGLSPCAVLLQRPPRLSSATRAQIANPERMQRIAGSAMHVQVGAHLGARRIRGSLASGWIALNGRRTEPSLTMPCRPNALAASSSPRTPAMWAWRLLPWGRQTGPDRGSSSAADPVDGLSHRFMRAWAGRLHDRRTDAALSPINPKNSLSKQSRSLHFKMTVGSR